MNNLRPEQVKFVDIFLNNGGNARLACAEAFNLKIPEKGSGYVDIKANRTIKNDKIRELIESHAETAQTEIFRLLTKAKAEAVRLAAGKDILDRAGYKPQEKIDLTSLNESINNPLNLFKEYEDLLLKRKETI